MVTPSTPSLRCCIFFFSFSLSCLFYVFSIPQTSRFFLSSILSSKYPHHLAFFFLTFITNSHWSFYSRLFVCVKYTKNDFYSNKTTTYNIIFYIIFIIPTDHQPQTQQSQDGRVRIRRLNICVSQNRRYLKKKLKWF